MFRGGFPELAPITRNLRSVAGSTSPKRLIFWAISVILVICG